MKIGSIKPEVIALREFFKEEAPPPSYSVNSKTI